MSFKLLKGSDFKLEIQPANPDGQTQLTIDNFNLELASPNGMLTSELLRTVLDPNEIEPDIAQSALDALQNRFVSKAYEDLYKRGVNPLRSEILLLSEFLPIATGETTESADSASINLNFGEASNLQVNQVMRLIDLQRIIRKTIVKICANIFEEYIDVPNTVQENVILHMHRALIENDKDFLSLGADTEKMVDLLIDISSDVSRMSRISLPAPDPGRGAMPGGTGDRGYVEFYRSFGRLGVAPIQVIRTMNEDSKKQGYVRSLARYVILDYVTQNTISFITKIFDLKDLLRQSISIAAAKLPPAQTHESTGIGAAVLQELPLGELGYIPGNGGSLLAAMSGPGAGTISSATPVAVPLNSGMRVDLLASLNLQGPPAVDRLKHVKALIERYGNKHHPAGSTESTESLANLLNTGQHSESQVEEEFGSNRHMYLNLFADMLNLMLCMDPVAPSSEEGLPEKSITKSKVTFSSSGKNLAKGLIALKSVTPKSMIKKAGMSILPKPTQAREFNGSKINSILSAVDPDRETALAELVAAVCYDQVAATNLFGSGDKLLAPREFPGFDGLGIDDNLSNVVLRYFNKVFFDTGYTSWSDLASSSTTTFDYSKYARDENKLGTYMKSRFTPREDEGTMYIPNEHTYEDNVHREDTFLIGSDYYFNKAIAEENIDFSKMLRDADKIDSDVDIICHDIAVIMGLDFDGDGNPEFNFNGYAKDSSPMTYFQSVCRALGAEARKTANDLKGGCDIAVPLIDAGSFASTSFLADVIRACFLTNMSTEANREMIMNFAEGPDGDYIEKNFSHVKSNVTKKDGTQDEAFCVIACEADYFVEERVWYKIFAEKLTSLLKDGDTKHLNVKDTKYPIANEQGEYRAVLYSNDDGIAKWFDGKKKNSSGDNVPDSRSKTFGKGSTATGHPKDFDDDASGAGSDDWFEGTLNFPDKTDAWAIWVAILGVTVVIAAAAVLGFVGAAYSVSQGIFSLASAGTLFTGLTTAAAGAATVGGILASVAAYMTLGLSAGALVYIWVDKQRDDDERPRGVAFSKSGYFESKLLRNAFLLPPSLRPRNEEEAENEAMINKAMSTLFGVAPNDNYILRPKPQPSPSKQIWHDNTLLNFADNLTELLQNGVNAFLAFFGFGQFTNDEGLVPDTDFYKPYNFEWNAKAGNYGGLFKTSTSSRFALFSMFFARVMHKSLAVKYVGKEGKIQFHYFATPWIAMADALEGKAPDSDFGDNGEFQNLKDAYHNTYNQTRRLMGMVEYRIIERRRHILARLRHLKCNANEIREAVRRSEKIMNGHSAELTIGEKISTRFLRKVGFSRLGMTFLNDNTAGTLIQHYHKNFTVDLRTDNEEDEVINPDSFSVFPFFKKENYDTRDLKLMARLFSEESRGFTSAPTNNLGRKSIIHIGVPMGMLRALQNEAYQKTGDISYYYSNIIAIHINKTNDLNPQVKYQARTYVFDMSKYIAPFRTNDSYSSIGRPGSYSLANHLENFDDSWSVSQIKDNMQIMTTNRKHVLFDIGMPGIMTIAKDENGSIQLEDIYDEKIYDAILENHIYDYYSKLYVHSTTGIDMNETQFPIDRNLLFNGDVDPASVETYESLVDEVVQRFPSANIDPAEAQKFYRVFKTMRSSLYFSSENRYESTLGTSCFQRIFSIPISERDFLLKNQHYNMSASDIYYPGKTPSLVASCKKTGLADGSIIIQTGVDEAPSLSSNGESQLGRGTQSTVLSEYSKILNPNKTDVSGFTVEISLLKSSKLG